MIRLRIAFASVTLLLSLLALTGTANAQATATATPTPPEVHARVAESVIDGAIPDDNAVDKMLEAYAPKVRALNVVIGKLKGDLRKSGIGAGSLGNFVTDGMRAQSTAKLGRPVDLAMTNGGGLRKNVISEGDLLERDIFELLPFENALVAFELNGAQVLDLLRVAVAHRDAQSGARIKYKIGANKNPELESVRLLTPAGEKEIDPAATYTVISIDYLLNRRSDKPSETEGDYSVLRQAKNIRPLGLTIRDAMINYVKSETAAQREIKANLDGRFSFDKEVPAPVEAPKP